jgi:hypothetical protein
MLPPKDTITPRRCCKLCLLQNDGTESGVSRVQRLVLVLQLGNTMILQKDQFMPSSYTFAITKGWQHTSRPPLLLLPLLTMPTIPPNPPLPPPNLRPKHPLLIGPRQSNRHQPKIIIQSVRIQQTHTPPILINPKPQIRPSIVQLVLQVVDVACVHLALRRTAVVVGVEGVVGEGLQVGEVGVVTGGFEGFELPENVVAGVVEDPVAVK